VICSPPVNSYTLQSLRYNLKQYVTKYAPHVPLFGKARDCSTNSSYVPLPAIRCRRVVFMDVIPFNLINVPKFWLKLVPSSLWYGDCARRFLQNLSNSLPTYNALHSTRLMSHILPLLACTSGKKNAKDDLTLLVNPAWPSLCWSRMELEDCVARQGADHHCGPCNTTKTFLSRKVISSFVNEYVL